MLTLNYHHLRYFWVVAQEGSLTRATERLRLAPSTISAQLKSLEEYFGHALFERSGRGLKLSEHGKVLKEYADDIFALGQELTQVMQSRTGGRHAYTLRVGLSNNLPKMVAYRLLEPVVALPDFPVRLVCYEDEANTLVADLVVHHLDLVLADAPVGLVAEESTHSELLGQCSISLFGKKELIDQYGRDLPGSLQDAPFLLPSRQSAMRRLVEDWFVEAQVRPKVIGEFADSALLKAFGQAGVGIFPAPSIVQKEIQKAYQVEAVGPLGGLRERFYAVVASRKLVNPAVQAILDGAHRALEQPRA